MGEYSKLIYEEKDGGLKEKVIEEQYGVSQRGKKDVFSYYAVSYTHLTLPTTPYV